MILLWEKISPLFFIAGPCVIESEELILDTASQLNAVSDELDVPIIFKSSFDKANRSSIDSYRGPGIEEGLRILQRVKDELNMPVLTDVHEDTPLDEVASVVDVMQTPAFLSRQTNFIVNVCAQGIPVNIKKGQFLRPWTCCRWRIRPSPPVINRLWCASEVPALVTTIWYQICARCR